MTWTRCLIVALLFLGGCFDPPERPKPCPPLMGEVTIIATGGQGYTDGDRWIVTFPRTLLQAPDGRRGWIDSDYGLVGDKFTIDLNSVAWR